MAATFLTEDSGDDGIDFWANNDGIGICGIYKAQGGLLKKFDGDFGDNINFEFTVGSPLKYEELVLDNSIAVYPNPAKSMFTIEAENIQNSSIFIYDKLNRTIDIPCGDNIKNLKIKLSITQVFWQKGYI